MTALDVGRLKRMSACRDGRESVRDCADMGEWWETTDRVDWMLWLCGRIGCDTNRICRYALWCARRMQHLTDDARVAASLDVAERYLDAADTEAQAAEVEHAAQAAAWAAARAVGAALAAHAAAWAVGAAAWAAWAAARAARAAAWASEAAAWAAWAAWAAQVAATTDDTQRAAQLTHLRELFPASEIQRLWDERHAQTKEG